MGNVGRTDRVVRAVVGIGALAIGYYFDSYWGLIGLVPLATAAVGWCPLYSACKLNTCYSNRVKS